VELPIALGKTISNETFVVDLAKMPHYWQELLVRKSVGFECGLNVVVV
jgi:hypothetical protein